MENKTDYDVIIIGGSFAGLSAAMALGRSLRSVLIIDSGTPCNRQTPHSHNFITQDGATPSDISVLAKVQVLRYPSVSFLNGKAVDAKREDHGFVIETENGDFFSAKKLLFATGVRDVAPDIAGFSECWGISILHCPYCHGYEARGQKTGIIADGEVGQHMVKLLSNWTDEVVLFTNGKSVLSEAEKEEIRSHNIRVEEKEVDRLEHTSGALHTMVFKDGSKEKIPVLYAKIKTPQVCELPEKLGCALTETGLIQVDAFQRSTVEDVFVAGDAATHGRAVSIAVASGTVAGITINGELISQKWADLVH